MLRNMITVVCIILFIWVGELYAQTENILAPPLEKFWNTPEERALSFYEKLLDEKNKVKRFSSAQKMQELGDSLILQGNYSTAWVRYSAGYLHHPSALLFFKAAEALMYNTLLHTKHPDALFTSLLGYETGFYFSRYETQQTKTVSDECLNKTKAKIECFKKLLSAEVQNSLEGINKTIPADVEKALRKCVNQEPHFLTIPKYCE